MHVEYCAFWFDVMMTIAGCFMAFRCYTTGLTKWRIFIKRWPDREMWNGGYAAGWDAGRKDYEQRLTWQGKPLLGTKID